MPLWVADFLAKTSTLEAKEVGAYMLLLMAMWSHDGALPADQKKLQRVARCGRDWPKIWNAIGHYFDEADGVITNRRLSKELQKVATKREVNAQHGALGGKAKALKSGNVGLANATVSLQRNSSIPEPEPYREDKVSANADTPELSEAVSIYNEAAGRSGWSVVQRMSKPRFSALKARIKDAGGLDGWRQAIARAEKSDFLCGRTSGRQSPFFASFDFLTQASSFTRLMEGNYDPRTPNPTHDARNLRPGDGRGTVDAFAAVAARYSGRTQ